MQYCIVKIVQLKFTLKLNDLSQTLNRIGIGIVLNGIFLNGIGIVVNGIANLNPSIADQQVTGAGFVLET